MVFALRNQFLHIKKVQVSSVALRRNCRPPPWCTWDLRSSGMLRTVEWHFVTDTSGKTYRVLEVGTDSLSRNVGNTAILRQQMLKLILEFGTDRLFRNVGNKLPFYDNKCWSWFLNLGPIGCPETSVKNYHSTTTMVEADPWRLDRQFVPKRW